MKPVSRKKGPPVIAALAALTAALAVLAGIGISGCASVQPWERATLGDYLMRSDRDPLTEALSEHVYFTREAAAGGRGVGGGGCGCN
jgi:hypothetical protein